MLPTVFQILPATLAPITLSVLILHSPYDLMGYTLGRSLSMFLPFCRDIGKSRGKRAAVMPSAGIILVTDSPFIAGLISDKLQGRLRRHAELLLYPDGLLSEFARTRAKTTVGGSSHEKSKSARLFDCDRCGSGHWCYLEGCMDLTAALAVGSWSEAAGFYNAFGASRGTRGRRDRAYLAGRAPLRLATFALPTHREVVAAALRISALG